MAEQGDFPAKNKKFTDEERAELAEKLDRELDDFVAGLGKKPYTEGWPEENWQEEFERHPFFMREPPKPGEEVHPLLEGLQRLKYDPDENTPEELAEAYKADGNFNFKHKNYRLAVISYTEGVKAQCGDPELEAALLNNRSAAHYHLQNYRSSLRDAESALKLLPGHEKALNRAANCCRELGQHEKAVKYCDLFLRKRRDDPKIEALKKLCLKEGKIKERDERKREKRLLKEVSKRRSLLLALRDRGVECEGGEVAIDRLRPPFPQLEDHVVRLNNEEELVWPVVFLYPEYQVMDFVQGFNENERFIDRLCQIFSQPPEWDVEKKYDADGLEIYYKTENDSNSFYVDVNKTLRNILSNETYVVKNGTPSFIVVVRDSEAEKRFLMQHPLQEQV